MKLLDTVIYEDFLLGPLTLQDLVDYLKHLQQENLKNLEILDPIFKIVGLEETERIYLQNKFDFSSKIQFILDVLSDEI